MIRRGDIIIVKFPYVDGRTGKNRPALVIQDDRNNGRLLNTIVAMISGNIDRARAEPTQLLVDPRTPQGKGSGLHGASAVKCENLFTVSQSDILGVIGHLPTKMMPKVDRCLKASLALR